MGFMAKKPDAEKALPTDAVKVAALQLHMTNAGDDVSFDSIRAEVVGFAGLTDGEVHQAVIDAGYEVING